MPVRPAFRQWQIWYVTWSNDAGGASPRRALLLSGASQVANGRLWFACIREKRPPGQYFTAIRRSEFPDQHRMTGLTYELCHVDPTDLRLFKPEEVGDYAGELPLVWQRDVAFKRLVIERLNAERKKIGAVPLPTPEP